MPSIDDSAETTDVQAPSYVVTFDPNADDCASDAIVRAIATLRDEDEAALEPLYEVVNPDALDALVAHAQRAADAGTHEFWFTYEGFDVGVRTDGEIRIRTATAAAN